MSHPEQQAFFRRLRDRFSHHFKYEISVLDCGSLDINGSLRSFFNTECQYTGIDVFAGRNVNTVTLVHEFKPETTYSTIVSAEMLEHDPYWPMSLTRMYELLASQGLLAISCAGPGREEHGTRRTGHAWGPNANYYGNLSVDVFLTFARRHDFTQYAVEENKHSHDIYFWGLKA